MKKNLTVQSISVTNARTSSFIRICENYDRSYEIGYEPADGENPELRIRNIGDLEMLYHMLDVYFKANRINPDQEI